MTDHVSAAEFGRDFHWGISSSAYQIEGAFDKDGKGLSIWDTFAHKRRKIHQNHNGDIACDFYSRYREDIQLINQLRIPNHRFSIAWSRLIPEGTGRISRKGLGYYDRLIDYTLEQGIEPWVTLYHWDLPQSLQAEGGWVNRNIINWFSDYAASCMKHFGDRVKYWMVLNEPMVFTGAGYFLGVHAPGKKGITNFLKALHHAALCQAAGGRVLKQLNASAKVGTTFSTSLVEPYSVNPKDVQAALRTDVLLNRVFIEPLLGMGYPVADLPILKRVEQFIKSGDEALLAFDMDFVGVQHYTREVVKFSGWVPFIQARIIKADKRNATRTQMNWEVYPDSMYQVLKKISAYPNLPEIIVTENGAAFPDQLINGQVKDLERIRFLRDYISQLYRAKKEGVNVNGYFVWTLMDNFEWAEGYYPTFGLVHVDRSTLVRTIKQSGYWYRDFISDMLIS